MFPTRVRDWAMQSAVPSLPVWRESSAERRSVAWRLLSMPVAPPLCARALSASIHLPASRAAAVSEMRRCRIKRKVVDHSNSSPLTLNSKLLQNPVKCTYLENLSGMHVWVSYVTEHRLLFPSDQPSVVPALPPGSASPPEGTASQMERPEPGGPHAIPRRHAPIEQLVRQGSFRGFPALSQKNSPFKRQLSLRLNDLPSTLQRKTDFEAKNPGELRLFCRLAYKCWQT